MCRYFLKISLILLALITIGYSATEDKDDGGSHAPKPLSLAHAELPVDEALLAQLLAATPAVAPTVASNFILEVMFTFGELAPQHICTYHIQSAEADSKHQDADYSSIEALLQSFSQPTMDSTIPRKRMVGFSMINGEPSLADLEVLFKLENAASSLMIANTTIGSDTKRLESVLNLLSRTRLSGDLTLSNNGLDDAAGIALASMIVHHKGRFNLLKSLSVAEPTAFSHELADQLRLMISQALPDSRDLRTKFGTTG